MKLNYINFKNRDILYSVKSDRIEFYDAESSGELFLVKYFYNDQNKSCACFELDDDVAVIFEKGNQHKVLIMNMMSIHPPVQINVDQKVVACQRFESGKYLLIATLNELRVYIKNGYSNVAKLKLQQQLQDVKIVQRNDQIIFYTLFRSKILKTYSFLDKQFFQTTTNLVLLKADQIQSINSRMAYLAYNKLMLEDNSNQLKVIIDNDVKAFKKIKIKNSHKDCLLVFQQDSARVWNGVNLQKYDCNLIDDLFLRDTPHLFAEYSDGGILSLCYYQAPNSDPSFTNKIIIHPIVNSQPLFQLLQSYDCCLFQCGFINPQIQYKIKSPENLNLKKGGLSYYVFLQLLNNNLLLFRKVVESFKPSQANQFTILVSCVNNALEQTNNYYALFSFISQLNTKFERSKFESKEMQHQLNEAKVKVKATLYYHLIQKQQSKSEQIYLSQEVRKHSFLNHYFKQKSNNQTNNNTQLSLNLIDTLKQKNDPKGRQLIYLSILKTINDQLTLDYLVYTVDPSLVIQSYQDMLLIQNISKLDRIDEKPIKIILDFIKRNKNNQTHLSKYFIDRLNNMRHYDLAMSILFTKLLKWNIGHLEDIVTIDHSVGGNTLLYSLDYFLSLGITKKDIQKFLLVYFDYLKKHHSKQNYQRFTAIPFTIQGTTILKPILNQILLHHC